MLGSCHIRTGAVVRSGKYLPSIPEHLGLTSSILGKLKLMWWHTLVIPALRKGKQEDQTFKVIPRYVVNFRQA